MKLSLRELFLLVALAAMGCGWWVNHRRLAANAEKTKLRGFETIDELVKDRNRWRTRARGAQSLVAETGYRLRYYVDSSGVTLQSAEQTEMSDGSPDARVLPDTD
jgi:hypothetical protein